MTLDWREQGWRYEQFANSRRVHARAPTATRLDSSPQPFFWLRLPANRFAFETFHAEGDDVAAALGEALRHGDSGTPLIPVHWAEARLLSQAHVDLELRQDGVALATASPRSLILHSPAADQPLALEGLEKWVIKTHLSQAAYDLFDGMHPGARELPRTAVRMAVVLSHVLQQVAEEIPRFAIQSEPLGVYAAPPGGGRPSLGCIFRRNEPPPLVPGFALVSPSTEPLPGGMAPPTPRPLILDVVARARQHHSTWSIEDALVALIVDPLLATFFTLAARGIGAPLHGQNVLFDIDPETGETRRVVARDMNGFTFCREYCRAHGLADLLAPDRVQAVLPWYGQEDLTAWMQSDGEVQRRFCEPDVFQFPFDMYVGSFFFQLLVSLHEHGTLDDDGVDALRERIKDRVTAACERAGFDLGRLEQPRTRPRPDRFWPAYYDPYGITDETGHKTRARILFRRDA